MLEPSPQIRTCPICKDQFSIQIGKRGKPAIFCDSKCKAAAQQLGPNNRPRVCPWCSTAHTLTPDQPASSTYCSPACKHASATNMRIYKSSLCLATNCYNQPTPNSHNQFCSTKCATASNPQTTNCQHCDEPQKYNPKTLRRQPRFCSQQCRNQWALANVPNASVAANNTNKAKTTRQLVKANTAKPKCLLAPSLKQRTAKTAPATLIWSTMPAEIQQMWESLGWNQEDWLTHNGTYSPAAWRQVLGTQLPTDVHLPAVEVQNRLLEV